MTSTDDLAAYLVRRYALTAADLVLEIGSGDGSFLGAVRQLGPRALGVEPDSAAVSRAWAAGVDTVVAHFGPEIAGYVRRKYGPARLVVARSVHAADIPRLVAVARGLAPDGAILISSGGVNALVEVRPEPTPAPLPRAA